MGRLSGAELSRQGIPPTALDAMYMVHIANAIFAVAHAIAYNEPSAGEAMQRVAHTLGAVSAADALFDLARHLGAPAALKDIGMPLDGIERAADLAVASPYPNPRPVKREGIRALLDDAFHGRRPRRTTSTVMESANA